jgi:hypothetical protein
MELEMEMEMEMVRQHGSMDVISNWPMAPMA